MCNNKIIEEYLSKKYTLKEISNMNNISIYMINKLLKENNIEKYKKGISKNNSIKYENEIVELYNKGYTKNKLIEMFNTRGKSIDDILTKNNITIRNNTDYRTKCMDKDFFKSIDTEVKAYILGLLYADGCLYKYDNGKYRPCQGFSIGLNEKDLYMIERIRNELKSEHKIKKSNHGKNGYTNNGFYSIAINRKDVYKDLKLIGLDNKNKFPLIDKSLMNHFIRGVFDGDGCVSIRPSKNEKHNYYAAEVHLMAEKDFLIEMISIIYKDTGIKFSDPKEVRNIYRSRKSGAINILKFKEYLYKDATIYLQRKYEKFAVLEYNRRKF